MFGITRAREVNPWIETDRIEFAKTTLTAIVYLSVASLGVVMLIWGLSRL